MDLCVQSGDSRRAERLLDEVSRKVPDDANLRSRLATLNLVTGRAADALDSLEQMRAAGVDNSAVRHNLAYGLVVESRFAEAHDLLEVLAQASKSLPEANLQLVRTLHHLGDSGATLVHSTRYTELQPDDAEGAAVRALIYLDRSESKEARMWAEEALARNPVNLETGITLVTLPLASPGGRPRASAVLRRRECLSH